MNSNKFKTLTPSLILCAFASGLVACGGGSSGESVVDTTAPTVSSTTPAASANSVARNSTITATFDEDIFAITVDASSFTLAKSGSINGTVTFDGVTNVATFTPSSGLSIHATYTATLSTAITDLRGNPLAADHSWSFVTADGAWGTAELIETGAGFAGSPQVAFDDHGNALVVWVQYDGTDAVYNIMANRFNGTSWGTAQLIETGAGNATAPQVAFDDQGNAIAVWVQYDGTGAVTNIMANRFNGTSWGTAELIETGSGDAFSPQVAVDGSGNVLAVWEQSDGIVYNVWGNRFNGTSWSTAELIETDAGNANAPQVAFDGSGNAIVVWVQSDGVVYNVWSNRFNGTSWGTAELIEIGAGNANVPQVAFDNSGNALAVWRQNDGSVDSIWASRFTGTSWGTAELIETGAGNATAPQVAFDDQGNALAVWHQSDGVVDNIMANRFK